MRRETSPPKNTHHQQTKMKTSDTNSEITDLESPSQENPETGDGGGDLCSVRILARLHIIFLVTMIGIMLLVIGIGMLALKNLETDDMMDTYDEALSMDDDVEFDIRPGYDYQTIAPSSSPTPNPSTDLSNESFLGYDSQTVAPSSSPTPNPSTDLSNEPSLGYDYQIVAPSSSPTPNPSTDLSNEPFLLQLEDIFGTEITGKLNDPESPQALAYDWILHQDELSFTRSSTNPTNVQRFILASFYFATGGRRTTASWSMCSAVPVTTDQDFSTPMRCVFEQNISVCAPHEHFLECPEYYQHMESPPRNPKKRWLSKSSECNWYGILCNEDGNVYQILLQDNGLAGVLISELNALEELTIIHLDDNNLEGALPKFDNLDLQHLSLYGNQLEGTLELADEWMDLRTLVLGGGNQLNVTLTPIFGLTEKLEFLDLGGNIVGSTLPITFGYSWSQLVQMKLGNTQLSGPLPKGLVGLTSLSKCAVPYYLLFVVQHH
jgi:hypothetical protein